MKLVCLSSSVRLDVDAIEGYFSGDNSTVVIIRRGLNELLTLNFENFVGREQCMRTLDTHLNPTR